MGYSTAKFYDLVSFVYPVINLFLQAHRKILIEEVNIAARGTLLDIGIGIGSHLPLYAGHDITGIDISEAMIIKARRYESNHVRSLIMDGEELQFASDSFDYVVICHVLAVTKNPDQLLDQVYKVLKPGGKLYILNHFTPDNWLRHVDHAFHFMSSILHFRSRFYLHSIGALQRFTLLQNRDLGKFAYFKFLIFCKP